MGTNPTSTVVDSDDGAQNNPHDTNVAFVAGRLANDPESRTLPSGSLAVSFSLTIRSPGEKTTSVPAVWYDPPKRVYHWVSGDDVIVQGAVVRRFFRSSGGLGSATEVVVKRGELARHRSKAAKVRHRVETLVASTETRH